jgi:hypothetical protein
LNICRYPIVVASGATRGAEVERNDDAGAERCSEEVNATPRLANGGDEMGAAAALVLETLHGGAEEVEVEVKNRCDKLPLR